jgi:hypothetical protein
MFEQEFGRTLRRGVTLGAVALVGLWSLTAADALAKHTSHASGARPAGGSAASGSTFSFGQPQGATVGGRGCGTNQDGEPSVHVSQAGDVFLGSEFGLGSGSDLWRALGGVGGAGTGACSLEYRGSPNTVAGVGASGGDIDVALAPVRNGSGNYNLYVASLNLASVNVTHSTDNGTSFTSVPVVAGLPGDDREWIAAFGADTSLLTFHDLATNNIDVLRSDNDGSVYTQIARAIPDADYQASSNQHGNLVIDHRNTAGTVPGGPLGKPGFWAYQSLVAPSTPSGSDNNEMFVAVSNDGGFTWGDPRPIPCSTSRRSLDHIFPNVSVDPSGRLWAAWSDDANVFTAVSADHGLSWTCSGRVSTSTAQALMPWIVATSAGEELVYYGSPTAPGPRAKQVFSVYFVRNPTGTPTGWGGPQQLVAVHQGGVCEEGFSCSGGRQLFDDFGIDTDPAGFAHIAYSHDAPKLGGDGTFTGYAVQTSGPTVGFPN